MRVTFVFNFFLVEYGSQVNIGFAVKTNSYMERFLR